MTTPRSDLKHLWLCVTFSLAVSSVAGASAVPSEESLRPGAGIDVKSIPYKIVYESLLKTDGKENWELVMINADGSNPVNLTKTPDIGEIYPHVSPDGTKICFEGEEEVGNKKVRSVYYMNIDGTHRATVAHNARQACWGPDSQSIAFLKAEFDRYTITDYATKGVYFYDLKTGKTTEHPNCAKLYHLYNLCWSPDGKWFLATVHGGMGFQHADLAFPAQGLEIFDLTPFGVRGCRPDFSPDGKRMTWGATDWDLCVADIDFSSGKARWQTYERLSSATRSTRSTTRISRRMASTSRSATDRRRAMPWAAAWPRPGTSASATCPANGCRLRLTAIITRSPTGYRRRRIDDFRLMI